MKETKGKFLRKSKGVTLVALVVTIVILIILASVSISAVFGENGIIQIAQDAKKQTESTITREETELNTLMAEYANIMAGGGEVALVEQVTVVPGTVELKEGDTTILTAKVMPENAIKKEVTWSSSNEQIATVTNGTVTAKKAGTCTITVTSTDGSKKQGTCTVTVKSKIEPDKELVIPPVLGSEMTAVKYNEETKKWERTTNTDIGWYNYGTRNWANAVLRGATFDSSGNLDESKTYSMVVWIPRYAYKITSGWHSNPTAGGTIDVKFIDTANKDKTGTVRNGTYNGSNGTYSDYVVHPAFNYGGTQIPGFWVGKFESSHTDCTTSSSSGEYNGTDKTMQIKAGVTSWKRITVDNIYKVCTGFSAGAGLDPHMLKNTEWGAVAYLSKSKYGKETEEVWNNSNNSYLTGHAGTGINASNESTGTTNAYNTGNGPKASTTGNVTGVYDMSGGAYEYVAGYVNNSYAADNGASVVSAPAKHKDVYSVGSRDTGSNNYPAAASKYGDAVYETSKSYSGGSDSWYQDYVSFPYSNFTWFERGGSCDSKNSCRSVLFLLQLWWHLQRLRFPCGSCRPRKIVVLRGVKRV